MKVLGTVIAASVVALGSVSPSAAATPAKPAVQGKRSTIKATRVSAVNGPRVARKSPMIDVVQLNQPPNGVNGFFADDACGLCGGPQSIADNFIINEPGGAFRLEQIDTFGGYFPTDNANTTDNFQILIHQDAGGLPGTVVFSTTGIQATNRVQTGVILFGVHEWQFTFMLATPPVLPNGTYWVEIGNSTSGNPSGDDYFWETGDQDPTNGIFDGVFALQYPGVTWAANGGNDQAVTFNGTSVPVELQGFSIE